METLLVCYVPGLDRRWLTAEDTPFLVEALEAYPWARLRTFPTTELLPVILTGLPPGRHGAWHVAPRPAPRSSPFQRVVDALPDLLTTTAQCVAHALRGPLDLPTIPPRRRRRFEIRRIKYIPRDRLGAHLLARGVPSVLSAVGLDRYGYIRSTRFPRVLAAAAALRPDRTLQFLEAYGFDLFEHWNLDRPQEIRRLHRALDRTVRELAERCRREGRRLLLVSDHGQEPVRNEVDVMGAVRRLGLPDEELAYYVEVTMASFWLIGERARHAVPAALEALPNGRVYDFRELERDFGMDFGPLPGVLFLADPGTILFPHDLYSPVVNLVMALSDGQQRSRLRNPRHRGEHGYHPDHPSQQGFAVLFDERWTARAPEASILDVAPTILSLLGREPLPQMTGRPLFQRSG